MIVHVKTIKFIIILLSISTVFFACSSKNSEPVESQPIVETIEVVETEKLPEPEIIPEPEPIIEPEPISQEDLEYSRSVSSLNVEVSKETFAIDKGEILEIIEKLSNIMKYRDYASWLNYLTPESKAFWSNQKNLALVSQRLPIKNYRLKDLQDYFEKVFIPSRIGRVVDEIRYISTTTVKAVQYTEEQDIIYYYFEKINGRWYLHLDTTI